MTARAVDPNMPFRVQQAQFNYLAMFVERTNVSGNYGDDSQSFFLTSSQDDWSEGEQQRFFRAGDKDSIRRYWSGTAVDVRTPGQVGLLQATGSIAFGATQYAAASDPASTISFIATSTTLYSTAYGVIANSNAHGLGATPATAAHDGKNAYLSTTTAGTVGVRKGDATGSLSTFSATAADVLCFHNNSLYGVVNSTGVLQVYSTGGVATTLYPWKRPDGTAASQTFTGMVSFGGKLLIVGLNQLWQYDGNGVSLIAQFPTNFVANLTAGSPCMAVVNGVVLVSGIEYRQGAAARPVVYAYAGGTIAKLWLSTGTASNANCRVAAFDGGVVWNDDATSRIMFWDPATGAITGLFTYSGPGPLLVANYTQLLVAGGVNSGVDTAYYSANTTATVGSVTTSLFDFDNSLTKLFRGAKIDFSAGTDGNGGSLDIAYQIDSVSGSFTTLQASAASGTEYFFPAATTGHSVALKLTLNKGTSTSGPILKRSYVRGAPQLSAFRVNEFILDLGGDPSSGQNPVVLRDGVTPHPLSGEQMRANLAAAITSATPITVTDRSGTYTAVLEPASCEFDLTRPSQWYARIQAREV